MENEIDKKKDIKDRDKTKQEHRINDIFKNKKRPPRNLGHSLKSKRLHFKSFKSPGTK